MLTFADSYRRRSDWLTVAGGTAVLAAALAWLYAEVVRTLVGQWWSNSMYSHGFLIPAIAIYLVWERRERILASWGVPAYAVGTMVLAAGLLMVIAGRLGSVVVIEQLSIIPTLVGVTLLVGGFGLLRALWFPIAYLLFMIPIWDVFTDRLHQPFQTFSAAFGERLMSAIGVPVTRTDTYIILPSVTLEVAQACSGVNYLVAVAALAIPMAHLAEVSKARKVALVMTGLVAAVLANGVRVALIGGLLYYRLWEDIHGPGHIFHGMFVAVVGYIALFVAAHWLGVTSPSNPPSARPGDRTPGLQLTALGWPLAFAAAFVVSAIVLQPVVHATALPSLQTSESIPFVIGPWNAVARGAGRSAVRGARPDEELNRSFALDGVGTVHLYVGYYASQRQGQEVVAHDATLPGTTAPATLSLAGESATVAEAWVESRGGAHQVVYWYDLNGRGTSNPLIAKCFTIWDGLFYGRTNGALIGVTLDPAAGVEPAAARAAALAFASEVLPALRKYLAPAKRS